MMDDTESTDIIQPCLKEDTRIDCKFHFYIIILIVAHYVLVTYYF